ASLTETGETFSGSTLEPNTFVNAPIEELEAMLEGARTGAALFFLKRYSDASAAHNTPIRYTGEVDEACSRIIGEWTISAQVGRIDGHFEMNRASSGAFEQVLRSVKSPVDIE
ncbi:MAG: hypothetical protein AAFQ67_09380, partial [Pseudomonadota bacterium]